MLTSDTSGAGDPPGIAESRQRRQRIAAIDSVVQHQTTEKLEHDNPDLMFRAANKLLVRHRVPRATATIFARS
jgi:hypothetical protein